MSQRPSPLGKRFRCYLGIHKWVRRVNEDAQYYECRFCGKYQDTGAAIMRYPGSKP